MITYLANQSAYLLSFYLLLIIISFSLHCFLLLIDIGNLNPTLNYYLRYCHTRKVVPLSSRKG